MQRFLYRVDYIHPDAHRSCESVCVRAADDDAAGALAEVVAATARYPALVGATREYTLLLVTADA